MRKLLLITLAILCTWSLSTAQTFTLVGSGFSTPVGMDIDADGNIWLTQTGTGNDDGKITVITPNGTTHDVITGLPSLFNAQTNEIIGAWRTYQLPDNRLMVVSGEGAHPLAGTLLTYDLTGFNLGDTPKTLNEYEEAFNIDDYVLGMGYSNSNPYSVAWNRAGDMFIVDAGANAVLKRDMTTDSLSVYVSFDDLPNPTPVGPPFTNAVPTKIISDGFDGFYVSTLTGFPFVTGLASIHHIESSGAVSTYVSGLTMVVDLQVDPSDGKLVALQFAQFGATGFESASAKAVKLNEDGSQTILAEGFGPSAGLEVDSTGSLYVSEIFGGAVQKISFSPPSNDNICNATPITLGAECGDTPNIQLAYSTVEENEPTFTCSNYEGEPAIYNSVWFSFVAPVGEVFIVAEQDNLERNSSFQLALFKSNGDCSDFTNLENVACDVPERPLLVSPIIQTTLTEGETYYVQVSGERNPSATAPYVSSGCLRIMEVSSPPNDEVCNAIELSVGEAPQLFHNIGATAQAAEFGISPPPDGIFGSNGTGWALGSNFIQQSVWFTFTTDETGGNYTIDLHDGNEVRGNFNAQVALYESSDCSALSSFNLLGASDNGFIERGDGSGVVTLQPQLDVFCLEGNTTYYIVVDGASNFLFQIATASQGFFHINVSKNETPLSIDSEVKGPTCAGGTDGSLIIDGAGGGGQYTYAWSSGDTIPHVVNTLAAGNYTVTMTDQCGVEIIETFEVPESNTEALAANVSDLSECAENVITLNANASGGVPFDTKRMFTQQSINFGENFFVKGTLGSNEAGDTLADVTSIHLVELEFIGDSLYGTDGDNLYKINTETGIITLIDSLYIPSLADLSYVPSKGIMYAVTNEGEVYELDPETATTTFKLAIPGVYISSAAIDNQEQLYAFRLNIFYKVDLITGESTDILATERFDLGTRNIEIDPSNDQLYLSVSTASSRNDNPLRFQSIHEVNKETGVVERKINEYQTPSAARAWAFANRTVAPYTYAWTPANILDDASSAMPTLVLDSSRIFSVTVSDVCGSTNASLTATAIPAIQTNIDTTITEGGMYDNITITTDTVITSVLIAASGCDSVVTTSISVIPTSIHDPEMDIAIFLYPNPSDHVIHIDTKGIKSKEMIMIIRDIHGRIWSTETMNSNTKTVDISSLASGQYALEIYTDDSLGVKRFIKR